MRTILVVLLLALALALAVSERFALLLSGYRPLAAPSVAALDAGADPDDRRAPRLLAERNRVELRVPWEMTIGDLVELYQLDQPHVRRQIAEQAGAEPGDRGHQLAAGEVFVVELTPVLEGSP